MAGLHPKLATVKRNLPRVARSMGFEARVTSGYRTRAKQAWLYNRYLKGLSNYPASPPGTSDHEKGLALDVVSTNPQKLVSLLTSVGLYWAGPADDIHFSLNPPRTQAKAISGPSTVHKVRSAADKVLDYTSWIPGPIGWGSMILDIFI